MSIDLERDSMKSVFSSMLESLSNSEQRNILYKAQTLPIVTERQHSILYFKIKNTCTISYPIGLTLDNGTVVNTEPNLEVFIDL